MTQKYGPCELCGKHALVADYGPDEEYICVECGTANQETADRIMAEMIRRHGNKYVRETVDEAIRKGTRH